MGKLIYLGYYDDARGERIVSPACVTMMDYIIQSINNAGYDLTVVSPALRKDNRKSDFVRWKINKRTQCIFLPCRSRGTGRYTPARIWSRLLRERDLLESLLEIVEDGDTLLVYHSLLLMNLVNRLRKRRKIRFVLQVCEIYSDVAEKVSDKGKKRELDYIAVADQYIFSTELLAQMYSGNKEYAVCLGNYHYSRSAGEVTGDGKIHVVYAGTLDPRKGGAYAAATAAEFLNETYHIHILGFGNEEEIQNITDLTKRISSGTCAKVTYDGVLRGEEYEAFLRACAIGLSTQNPDSAFNETSFPSKILAYMANGLRVVSARIPAVETSEIGPYLYYYSDQSPEAIAKAIMCVELSDTYDAESVLNQLDERFCDALKKLIK